MVDINKQEQLFPILSDLINRDFPSRLLEWIEAKHEYFLLLEKDLTNLLRKSIRIDLLRNCYKDKFLKDCGVLETIYEIHFGSMLSKIADSISISIPRSPGEKTNFDFKAEIEAIPINIEVETRKDLFPFTGSRIENTEVYVAVRETVDKRLLNGKNVRTPESATIRTKIREAFNQLPDSGYNFVALGQVWAPRASLAARAVKDALYGDILIQAYKSAPGRIIKSRLPNGLFSINKDDQKNNKLQGVIWFCLQEKDDEINEVSLMFINDNYRPRLPEHTLAALRDVFDTGRDLVTAHNHRS